MTRWAKSAVAGFALAAALPAAAQNAANGEKVFRKCKACHQVGEDAGHRTGPALNGIVGGAIAAQEGFDYSEAFTAFAEAEQVWSEELLDTYLEKPRALIKGTAMRFAGLRKPEERRDVIAYLATIGGGTEPATGTYQVAPEILALEGDPDYGAYLSGECTTCHQVDGGADGIPAIVGMETKEFVTAMHAYRAGVRVHPVMQMIAGRLSDQEIAALAAYFDGFES